MGLPSSGSGAFDLDRPGPFVARRDRTSMTPPTPLPATLLIATTTEWESVAAPLGDAGFTVVHAESGVAALGRARVVRPDAIILSAELP